MNFPEPKRQGGNPCKLSRMQQVELWAWRCARKHLAEQEREIRAARLALGTIKTKAKQMGVEPWYLHRVFTRLNKRACR